jgi:hypothetical protein
MPTQRRSHASRGASVVKFPNGSRIRRGRASR